MVPFEQSHTPLDSVTENYINAMRACAELRWQDAIALFDNEPEGSPAYGLALGNKGQALQKLDRYPEAEECLRRSLKVIGDKGCLHAPSEVQFHRNLAEAVGRQGRWAESLPLFDAAAGRAEELLKRCEREREPIRLQQAHVFNSYGSSYLYLRRWKGAVEQYENARVIFRELGAGVREGYAETLTNLALALTHLDELMPAELALKEAQAIASGSGDDDQVFRIKIAAIQMGSALVPAEDREGMLLDAAAYSLSHGQLRTGYLRYCIGARAAEDVSAPDEGMRFIAHARSLEGAIPYDDPHIAMLRGTEGELLRLKGAPDATILPVLIDGARRWYERLGRDIVAADFAAVTRSMHNHFRMLARHLLNDHRPLEALATFEAGRSLLHYRELHPAFLTEAIRRNPFAHSEHAVDTTAVREAQNTLRAGECAVVLAVLPPELLAFVVWNDRIEVVTAPWPTTLAEGNDLIDATKMIPHRLVQWVGERSIPDLYHAFAGRLLHAVGTARICGMTPYSILHLVPWRAVLHAQGAPWTQLAFSTGFGFLLRTACQTTVTTADVSAVALGHGTAEAIDLKDESRRFVAEFGGRGEFVPSCRVADIRAALASARIVHLSCHGKVVATETGQLATFEVAGDGGDTVPVEMHEVMPDTVNSPLVILSACESGVYEMQWGEFPTGAAPLLLHGGAQRCMGSRFLLRVVFAQIFFPLLAKELASGRSVEGAFASALATAETSGQNLWRDLACVELLGGA
ncbi:MAG: CHAT domain-containing protein [Planctomycetes bacterium]|nr:CHAT domain-containing protein [Planctomycetota bacterium]